MYSSNLSFGWSLFLKLEQFLFKLQLFVILLFNFIIFIFILNIYWRFFVKLLLNFLLCLYYFTARCPAAKSSFLKFTSRMLHETDKWTFAQNSLFETHWGISWAIHSSNHYTSFPCSHYRVMVFHPSMITKPTSC